MSQDRFEDAENFLLNLGFMQIRVRHHGPVARIEAARTDLLRFLEEDMRTKIIKRFKELGFNHISLDLEGFVSGSMNRSLQDKY